MERNDEKDCLGQDERGQTVVEYALVVSLCVLVLVGVTIEILDVTSDFYSNVVRLICLPLP